MASTKVSTSTAATIDDLPSSVLLLVFSRLGFKDCAAVACVQRSWNGLSSEDVIWRELCSKDWLVTESSESSSSTENLQPTPKFKNLYRAYHKEFERYGSLYLRAKRAWNATERWVSERIPQILPTILDGATEAELDEFEAAMDVKLPPAFRVFYRIHSGQSTPDDEPEDEASLFYGLLGGYSFYHHVVNMRLLSLRDCLEYSRYIRVNIRRHLKPTLIVIGASFNSAKLVFLDCSSGKVYINGKTFAMRSLVPAVSTNESNSTEEQTQDQLLEWFEEYSDRLQRGVYSVQSLWDTRPSKSICIFPELGPEVSCQITNRVRVRASAVFIPEASDHPQERYGTLLFSYSIRISLMPAKPEDARFSKCQLHSRHWIIRDDQDVVTSEVHGEAVIGKYPILTSDGEEFVYQSCCEMQGQSGSIEGSFTFVPGTIRNPEGPPFEVVVGKFPLRFPDYIY